MKFRQHRPPSEALYRRTLRAAGVMAAAPWLMWLASPMLQIGHEAASQPNLPETRPGIGKNVEVNVHNLAHNVINEATASVYTEIGRYGLGASILLEVVGAANLIVVACKLDSQAKAEATRVPELTPTHQLVSPTSYWYPEHHPEPAAIELTDFAETQLLSAVTV